MIKHDAFLSYASEDNELASKLVQALGSPSVSEFMSQKID